MENPKKIVFLDIETTGDRPGKHRIVQIAGVGTIDWEIDYTFEAKVRLTVDDYYEDEDINHILPSCHQYDVWEKEAIEPIKALRRLRTELEKSKDILQYSLTTGKPFHTTQVAGHNIIGFDLLHINAWFKQIEKQQLADYDDRIDAYNSNNELFKGIRPIKPQRIFNPIAYGAIDTLVLAKARAYAKNEWPKNLRLSTLCEYYGVELDRSNGHNALDDAIASFELCKKLLGK